MYISILGIFRVHGLSMQPAHCAALGPRLRAVQCTPVTPPPPGWLGQAGVAAQLLLVRSCSI